MNIGAALKLHLRGHYTNCLMLLQQQQQFFSSSIEYPLQEPKWHTVAQRRVFHKANNHLRKLSYVTKQAHANFYTPHVVCDEIQHQVMDSLGYNSIAHKILIVCWLNLYIFPEHSMLKIKENHPSYFKLFVLWLLSQLWGNLSTK